MNGLVSAENWDCPRCGYDLRGNVALWEERGVCPLVGKCSECGLDFEWQRVFREAEHPWLFEYHWRRKPIRSFVQTLWRSALPWKFWREVDLFWAVRIWPLLAMLGICLTGPLLSLYGLHVWQNQHGTSIYYWWGSRAGTSTADNLFNGLKDLWVVIRESATLGGVLAWAVSIPLAFCLLPVSLQRAKIRRVHLVRCFCYSILLMLPITLVATQLMRVYYWETMEFQDNIVEVARSLGVGVVWFLRDLLGVSGVSQDDGAALIYSLVSGLFFVPYWWFACTRYLKIGAPERIVFAISIVASLMVTAFAMCGLLI